MLILAGINNSGPDHWQSLWQKKHPEFLKVQHRDWDHPVCSEWMADLEKAVEGAGTETVLVAHSLGCLLLVHWAAKSLLPVKAALLVSVPDPSGANFPEEAKGFDDLPSGRFRFPSIIVASTNDPYGSHEHMQACAEMWGSRFITLGAYGHINASSGLGSWPEGYELLSSLRK